MLLSMEMAAGIRHVRVAGARRRGAPSGGERPRTVPPRTTWSDGRPPRTPLGGLGGRSRVSRKRESAAARGRSGVDQVPSPQRFPCAGRTAVTSRTCSRDVREQAGGAHAHRALVVVHPGRQPAPAAGSRAGASTRRVGGAPARRIGSEACELKLFASMVSRHGLKPTQCAQGRETACPTATIASLVCEALDPDPSHRLRSGAVPGAIAELRDGTELPRQFRRSSDGAPP